MPPPGALRDRARGRRGAPSGPTIDSRTPRRSAGHRGRVEARAAVAHEHLRCVAPSPRRRRRPASRRRTSPRSSSPRAPPPPRASARCVELAVADHDHLDRHAVVLLDLGGRRLQRARQPRRLRRAPAARPSHARSSRSWRRASAATSLGSSARRCTSASVWSTESCRCAATSARSCERIRSARSSVSERTSRTTHGAKITPSTDHGGDHGEQHVARRAERAGGLQEHEAGGDHQRDPDAGARDRRRRAAALARQRRSVRRARPARAGGASRAARAGPPRAASPVDWRQISAPPAGDQHERPHDRVGEPQPELAEGEQDREQQQPVPSATSTAAAAGPDAARVPAPGRRPGSAASRAGRPRCPTPPAAVGDHEREPDQRESIAVAARDPGARRRRASPSLAVAPQHARGSGRGRSHGDHRGRLMPDASRIAPSAAHAAGPERREAEVDRADGVEQQQHAERDHGQARDQRGDVGLYATQPVFCSRGRRASGAAAKCRAGRSPRSASSRGRTRERADARRSPFSSRRVLAGGASGRSSKSTSTPPLCAVEGAHLADAHLRRRWRRRRSSGTSTRASPMPTSDLQRHVARAAGPSGAGRRPAGRCRAGTRRAARQPRPAGSRGRPTPPSRSSPAAGHDAGRQRQRHRREHEPAHRPDECAHQRSPRPRRSRRSPRPSRRPAAAAQAPPIAISPQTMRTPTPSAARLAMSPASPAGSLSGDEPPDQHAGADENGERDHEPRDEEAAAEKKGPAHAQEQDHAARSRASGCVPSRRLAACESSLRDQQPRREVGERGPRRRRARARSPRSGR